MSLGESTSSMQYRDFHHEINRIVTVNSMSLATIIKYQIMYRILNYLPISDRINAFNQVFRHRVSYMNMYREYAPKSISFVSIGDVFMAYANLCQLWSHRSIDIQINQNNRGRLSSGIIIVYGNIVVRDSTLGHSFDMHDYTSVCNVRDLFTYIDREYPHLVNISDMEGAFHASLGALVKGRQAYSRSKKVSNDMLHSMFEPNSNIPKIRRSLLSAYNPYRIPIQYNGIVYDVHIGDIDAHIIPDVMHFKLKKVLEYIFIHIPPKGCTSIRSVPYSFGDITFS